MTKFRCKDLPDSDRGDFSCRRAVDSSISRSDISWVVNLEQFITSGLSLLNSLVWLIKKYYTVYSTAMTNYTLRFNKVERGVYWFHLVRLSVCPSVRLWTESCLLCIFNNTHGSISYLHTLSSNFGRCVVCNVCFQIRKF